MKPSTETNPSVFLQAAEHIGTKLCAEAIWADKRCNWLERVDVPGEGRGTTPVCRACGPDFRSGTSGIALFLGRLYSCTGEKIFRLTAEGAIRQALSRLDDFPVAHRAAFHSGLIGVGYVLCELADRFEVEKFVAMSRLILEEAEKGSNDERESRAETVLALLAMHRKRPDDLLLGMAVRHGASLAQSFGRDPTPQCAVARVALLSLQQATGKAVASSCFTAGVWSENEWLGPLSALASLRAWELTPDPETLRRAKSAAHAAADRLVEGESEPNFSLANGQSGVGEVLLRASRTLNEPSFRDLAERIGLNGWERYGEPKLPWSCSSPGAQETPTLLPGLAGIGTFYLRLYKEEKTESVLLVS